MWQTVCHATDKLVRLSAMRQTDCSSCSKHLLSKVHETRQSDCFSIQQTGPMSRLQNVRGEPLGTQFYSVQKFERQCCLTHRSDENGRCIKQDGVMVLIYEPERSDQQRTFAPAANFFACSTPLAASVQNTSESFACSLGRLTVANKELTCSSEVVCSSTYAYRALPVCPMH